ncbi:type IV toxin-antitoxin system AbiEi family antitoxin [Subtercola boreus]|uniref:AbiEi antitoxin C-terminal domain-containing protein n=1 Tax=Subtercola boreus TaxID=120213 RepID=A0A3E0WAG2_9MICO|nr:type IV toxin-antitoxin system AbiEi family antitoxin [Subtercola boreus]RFA19458.1 hypothetical protein B7R24_12530 [Subtercola boreus]RFA19719.1 hypothetical protein B7R23_12510 [Subtercola boreus]RFA26085.1 hypothetical protein B7R25_12630 [Subtercola boreus]
MAGTRQRAVIGYESAAILWGYPRLGAWPREVHLVSAPGSGAHSRAAVREHRVQLPAEDVTRVDGLRVTTPLRTLVDVARSCSTLAAVVMIDHALNRDVCAPELQADLPELEHLARERVRGRGQAKVRLAIGAARVGATSPGESWSRLLMSDFGMPKPALQTRHANPRGGFYYTDFEWPELKIIGEFDGRGKYLKPEYLGSMSPGEAVVAEKIREDHLRAEGNNVARWMFDDLRTPTRLRSLLTTAGVPVIRK